MAFPRKLRSKINVVLVAFFICALAVIVHTIGLTRQLEGGAAAINVAGSQRMRINGLALALHQAHDGTMAREVALIRARAAMAEFEQTLSLLETGDPDRPLFLPRETRVAKKMSEIESDWQGDIKPRVVRLLDGSDARSELVGFDGALARYLPKIDELVLLIERSSAQHTYAVYLFQNALVGFSLLGTIFLLNLFYRLVISPVEQLRGGIERMAAGEFGARLAVVTEDEFGELAAGFNRMGDHLQDLYRTLEARVAEKTRSAEERNRELALLYETAAQLAESQATEPACRAVLDKLCDFVAAAGGVMRLVNAKGELDIVASRNMSEGFVAAENHLPIGQCLCGRAAECGVSVTCELAHPPADLALLSNCAQEGCNGGCKAMAAIPVRSKSQVFGIITLFFAEARVLAQHELQLVEAIGQHLSLTIEKLRLVVREKQMAVSEERNLLAQELHDSIAQSLAFLNIEAQMLSRTLSRESPAAADLARMREGIQQCYDDVRELLVHFRTAVDHGDLTAAIRNALEKFEGQTGIATRFAVRGDGPVPAAANAVQVLHIVQEALSNVRKHAAARHVDVALERGAEVTISVRDDGRGFDPAAVMEEGGAHVGLSIMRERAHRIGARLEVSSAPETGTCVTLALPV